MTAAAPRPWRRASALGLLTAMLIIGVAVPADAGLPARSGPGAVSLLEVYSSEGCSSCPPGEEWVSGLADDPGLWSRFVPVVLHVDYWDYLGWKDPFSKKVFSERQREYAAYWRSSSVYTPGFVLDGKEWRDWHRRDPAVPARSGRPGELTVDRSGAGEFVVTYRPADDAGARGYRAHAAIVGSGIRVDVRSGENGGRRLLHDFAALDYAESAMRRSDDGSWTARVRLDPDAGPSEARRAAKRGIAVWVAAADSLVPVQAAGAYF